MLLQIFSSGDSTIISKIDLVAKSVAELQKKVTLSPWIPFFTALLGGILVMLGQYFERRSKRKQEKLKEINEAFTKSELLLFSLKGLVKELSGDKTLSRFWHYNHTLEEEAADGDKELSKKYYDNSLVQASAAVDCKSKIGDFLAQYYSSVAKFQTLSNNKIDVTELKNLQTDAVFDDAPEFDKSLTPKQALELFHVNNLALSTKYLAMLTPLDSINNNMQSICQKLNK